MACSRKLEPNWTVFRKLYKQYADEEQYPDELFEMVWEQVTCIVSDEGYSPMLGDCRMMLLYAMLCHFLTLANNTTGQGGFVTNSTIDKVSVTKAAPPSPNMFYWWLGQTPCGQAALAMLEAAAVGGDYIGGGGEMAAFRRVGGVFRPSTLPFPTL
jgi:hypothetical protein